MRNEESKNDVVERSRALLTKTAPQGKITNGADAYLFDMQAPRLLSALCDEVEQLKRDKQFLGERLEAQAETMSRVVAERNGLRESSRVMKEAIEAVIIHFQMKRDVTNAAFAKGLPVAPMPGKELQLIEQLESAITPKGSRK